MANSVLVSPENWFDIPGLARSREADNPIELTLVEVDGRCPRVFVAPYVEVASGDRDGIPTAVLEAMSTGLPVIATDAGSIVEAVTAGSEGVTVPQRDAVGLADAIERLLTNRGMYVRMAEAARHRAVTEFDVHVTERRLHERIKACIKPHAATVADLREQ